MYFPLGFNCLATRGTMVLFGGASGYPESLDLSLLSCGSRSLVHPKLFDYVSTPEELKTRADDVFKWITEGKIKVGDFTVLPLSEARKAHDMLEGKKTTGKVLLKPWSIAWYILSRHRLIGISLLLMCLNIPCALLQIAADWNIPFS